MLFASLFWTALALTGAMPIQPKLIPFWPYWPCTPSTSLLDPVNKVQPGYRGDAILRFAPKLHIASGCQPYAMIDEDTQISCGLAPGGLSNGDCSDTTNGQMYARIGANALTNMTGIMYAFYFLKDQLLDDIVTGAHRNDIECVIIWLDDKLEKVIGGSASGHGRFKIRHGALPGGDSPRVEYFAQAPTNHELQFTETIGKPYPIWDWDVMPWKVKERLSMYDFGSANVPFLNVIFQENLEKAAL